jgi:DNA-binding MarR family transcriptional regulator
MSGGNLPTDEDYADLLRFRDALRRFLRWSEQRAREAQLTPAQHQLLLTIRGHDGDPTISEVAAHLLLRHHSAVELVDRAERAGLVERRADPDSRRVVRLALSAEGEARLAALTAAALDELAQLRLTLRVRHVAPT